MLFFITMSGSITHHIKKKFTVSGLFWMTKNILLWSYCSFLGKKLSRWLLLLIWNKKLSQNFKIKLSRNATLIQTNLQSSAHMCCVFARWFIYNSQWWIMGRLIVLTVILLDCNSLQDENNCRSVCNLLTLRSCCIHIHQINSSRNRWWLN